MMQLRLSLAVVVLAGCSAGAPGSPSASATPGPMATFATTSTPTAVWTPTTRPPPPTDSNPQTLPPPPPGVTLEPLPSPTATSASTSAWRKVQEFEPPPSIQITSVTVGGPGFVAVGWADVLLQEGGCFGSFQDGRVLLSTDGQQWTTLGTDTFAYSRLDYVVESADDLYVLGSVSAIGVGIEETPGACGQPPENIGFNVWRSSDDGASWEQLAQSAEMQNALVTDIISMDGELVAIGLLDQPRSALSAVWTSPDGIDWRMSDTPRTTLPMSSNNLATNGNVLVAAGNEDPSPFAYSEDGGRTWHEASVDIETATLHWSVAARDGRFVAVGGVERPSDDYEMNVLTSEDGKTWTEASTLQLGSSLMNMLIALPGHFLGFGSEFAVETNGVSYTGARAWVSVDGIDWLPAPAPPPDGLVTDVAPGPNGVVAATWAREALWFTPLSTFE